MFTINGVVSLFFFLCRRLDYGSRVIFREIGKGGDGSGRC